MNAAKAISEKKKAQLPTACLFMLGLVFVIAGLVAFWFSLLNPALRSIQAANWSKTEAVIVSSEIKETVGDDGSTYKPEIHFSYQVDGQDLLSKKWAFSVWSGGRKWAKSVSDRYPPGSKHECFYNPTNPADTVLERQFQWINLLGLFTLPFVAIGAAILWFELRSKFEPESDPSRLTSGLSASNESTGTQAVHGSPVLVSKTVTPWNDFAGPQKLKPETSRLGRLIGTSIFALFWNVISWFIFVRVIQEEGWLSLPGVILTIFVLIGFIAAIGAFYLFLTLFNPFITVALSNGAVVAGETVDIAWETEGRADRISELIVELTGQEKATYTRGTSTYTDKQQFLKIPVVRTSDSESIRFGSLTLRIPADTMHTFEAPNNKIEWAIEVQGIVRWWPDVKESMQFFVKPAEHRGADE